jgi:aryl-alcohol dehydrogenase-like predicted oxidoreductase
MALAKNEAAAQVALAWLMRQGADILPIPGMNSKHQAQRYLGVPHAISPE